MNYSKEQSIETREPVGENEQQPQPPVIENEKIKEATEAPVPEADKFQHQNPPPDHNEKKEKDPDSNG